MSIEKAMIELENIAQEACKLGHQLYGRGLETLTTNIRTYTADTGNHQSCQIYGIDVALFRPAHFTFKISEINEIEAIVKKAKAELDEFKVQLEATDEQEAEAKKQERIAGLKKQLEELES